jgi:hypothetical protein
MLKLGFVPAWTDIIIGMISSVSFSVLFNWTKFEEFKPSRGIRQGDPISPKHFLIAADGLSCLLNHRSHSSNHSGIKVAPSAPSVNHLLSADVSLLFLKANGEGAREISESLELYCKALGQKVNLAKSSIFFSKGCPEAVLQQVKSILNVTTESLSEKYLGMPTNVGKSKNGAFKNLKDRVWSKVQGWMEMIFSV